MQHVPNIVLTIADDQRFDTIAAHGNAVISTPHLDRLAARGTSFRRAYIPGSSHGAVCAPSRAMLHTGRGLFDTSDDMCATRPPVSLGRVGDAAQPLPTLGQHLRDAGYDCYMIGKWHNGGPSLARSFTDGSRIFHGGMASHFCVVTQDFDSTGGLAGRSQLIGGHSTDVFTDAAVDFIRRRSNERGRPFFLYVAYTAPHDPRETLFRWHAMYDDPSMPVPPNFAPQHPFDFGHLRQRDEMLAGFPRTPEEVQFHLARYFAMISHLDDGLGRVHAALEEAKLTASTLIIHTADHGLSVGQHGLLGKQNLYDPSIRVPLLMAGPGIEHGRDVDSLCYMQDLFPTLLRAAGISAPPGAFESLDIPRRDRPIVSVFAEAQRSIRVGDLKLIRSRTAAGRIDQLFDLAHDPGETQNLADTNSSANVSLSLQLTQQLRALHDPLAADFA